MPKSTLPNRTGKVLLSLMSLVYFASIVLSHEWVSLRVQTAFRHFGRSTMESSLHAASLLIGGVVTAICLLVLWRRNRLSVQTIVLWAIMLGLMILADALLVVTNVERIHYFQYAALALLARAVIPDDFFVLFLVTMAGVLDELIQYVWNPHYTKYLDFNDFVLNLLGALLGIALYLTFFSKDLEFRRKKGPSQGLSSVFQGSDSAPGQRIGESRGFLGGLRMKSVVYLASGLLVCGTILGVFAGRIIPYGSQDKPLHVIEEVNGQKALVLSFVKHAGFWTVAPYGRKYHILTPIEGLVVLGMLLLSFKMLFDGFPGLSKGSQEIALRQKVQF